MPFAIPFWVYAALMAAGTGAQMMGQKKVDNERAKRMLEERMRREKLSRENEASAEASKNLFANVRKDEEAKAAATAQNIAAPAPKVADVASGRILDPNSPTASTSTVEGAKTALAGVEGKLAREARARAAAGAFSGVMGDYNRALFNNAQDIDINSTSMRNWNQNVLPAQLEAANQSGRDWNTTGDILKLAGTIMAPWALGGGGAGSATSQIAQARFGDVAKLAQGFGAGGSIPFGSNLGMSALAQAGGMGGMSFMADERLQELMALQRLGHRLSFDDLQYIKDNSHPGMLH